MLRNLSRTLLIAGAAWLAAASALSAQEIAPLRGDVDGDGRVTTADARIVADYLVGRPVPAGADVAGRGDVNGDGRVTSVDVAIINGFAAGRDVSRFKVNTPAGALPAGALAAITCRADLSAGRLSCGVPGQAGGARSEVNVGGQHVFVELVANNLQIDSTTDPSKREARFDVAVKNLLVQKLGTTDGTTADPAGVRVYFYQEPTATNGESGIVTVANSAGTLLFTPGVRNYFQYTAAPLDSGAVTPAQQWHLSMPSGVRHVEWQMYVAAEVQFPRGWIDIYPPSHSPTPYLVFTDTVSADPAAPNHTLKIYGIVRNFAGEGAPNTPITWSNKTPAVSTVAPTTGDSALVTGVADGVDTVTATAPHTNPGNRTGRVQIVVSTADSTTSTITAAPSPLNVGDSSTVTVQLKNAANANLTRSGGTVALSVSAGATLTAVTDNGDGTYTAKVTSTTSGTYTISGTLNGHTLVNTGSVTFNAGAPAALFFTTQPSSAASDASLGSVTVTARDGSGNVATSFTGNVTVSLNAGNGATLAGTTTKAAVAGVATFSDLSVAKAGTGYTLSAASAPLTGATSDPFDVTPGAAANIAKTGDAQSAVVGTTVSIIPSVTITDANGNPVPGVSVTFTPSGNGTVGNTSTTTDGSGVASAGSWKLATAAGANTLGVSANSGALTASFTATGTPDLPATVTKTSTDPQNGTVGNAVGSAPAVHVVDQYGNAVAAGTTITFGVTGGGTVTKDATSSTTSVQVTTDASGNAALTSWTLGGSGLNTVQVSASEGTANPVTFTAYVPPVANPDVSDAMGNTPLATDVTPNVLTNDVSTNGGTLSVTSTGDSATARGGTITMNSNGTFSYVPAVGITGRDSVQYTLSDTHISVKGWIKFQFVGIAWYVDSSAGASGDGRYNTPLQSVGAAATAAGTNETILVRTGGASTAGGTLKAGQQVYGAGASAPFNVTLNTNHVVTLLPTGSAPTVGALTLGSGNTLRGFTSSGGISGTNFGTLTVQEVAINNTAGQALSLNTGTLALAGTGFTSVQSGGGTNNVSLTSVSTSGTATIGTAGDALSGATSDGVVVSGGSGSFTFPANISNATSFAVNVNGKTGGTVTFSGNINPGAAARGISVTGNNSGVNNIVFSGGTKNISSGAAAGVVLTNNTGANISFTNGGLTIASSTGTPFSATTGGGLEVTGAGNTISVTGAAAKAVNLSGMTLGANGVSFASISSSGTTTGSAFSATSVGGGAFTVGSLTVAGTAAGTNRGLELVSNSAPFTFTTLSVNGTGGEGIYLNGNTGAVAINGGTVGNTSNTTGDALYVNAGNADVTVAASLAKTSTGRIANIGSHTAGTVTVSGTLSCTGSCTGINVANNSGGTIDFTNASQTLSTGANAAVTLSSNTGATINFSGGSLAITTGAGAGINAAGGGTVTVTGANNTINSSGGGTAVTVSSTTIGANGLTFKRIDATGSGTNGIVLSSTGSGAFTVTGDGASDPNNTTRGRTTAKSGGGTLALGSGGSISGRSGHGVSLSSTGAVTLRNMVVTGSGSSGDGINASSTGRLTIDNTRITGASNDHGLWGSSVSGLAIHHSEIDNNATTAGVVEGPDIWNVRLLELTGTDSIRNSNIHHSQEDVLGILNTSGTLNLTVLNTNITDTGTGAGGTTAFAVSASGTSNVTLNLQNDSINRGRARGVDFGTGTSSSAVLNTTINNSQFMQNGAAISIVQGSSGTNTFNITNNNLQSNDAGSLQAMIINRAGSPSFNSFGLFTGTISGNTIGTTGVANSGSGTSNGIDIKSNGSGGATRVAVLNNTIRQVGLNGISVAVVDGNTGGTTPPTMEARIQGNDISVLNAAIGADGINIQSGALSTDDVTMCVDIISNTSVGIRNGLRVRGSGVPTAPATIQLEGWDGSTARATYFANRPNTLSGGTAAYSENVPSAPGGYVAVANCNTP